MNGKTEQPTGFSGWQELTVGQMVARYPRTARVFETRGIDYCCGGKRSLAEACERKGLDPASIRADLAEALRAEPPAGETDWDRVPIADLIDHIESSHHGFIRAERPRLTALARKVARVHGERHPELEELASAVDRVFQDLDPHLAKEEQDFFPAFRTWARSAPGTAPEASLLEAAERLEQEHADIGKLLGSIQELTSGFQPPQDACNSYLALFHGLEQLDADLHEHIHEENNILHVRIARAVPAAASSETILDVGKPVRNGPRPETCCGM